MPRAEQLLACVLTYREAETRTAPLEACFADADAAVGIMTVLLHEAREAMQTPLAVPPDAPYLHPVDVDTDEPGIVDRRDELHVLRCRPDVPRVAYVRRVAHGRSHAPANDRPAPEDAPPILPPTTAAEAEEAAREALRRTPSSRSGAPPPPKAAAKRQEAGRGARAGDARGARRAARCGARRGPPT